jgi:hypothetical protein
MLLNGPRVIFMQKNLVKHQQTPIMDDEEEGEMVSGGERLKKCFTSRRRARETR